MLYTSYFAKLKKLPENAITVAICLKVPEWYDGLEYKKLAPKPGFFQEWKKTHDNDFYIRHFHDEVLAPLDVDAVLAEISGLLPDDVKARLNVPVWESPDVHIAMLCYEKPEDFCHRHLVAKWLNGNGVECKEWAEPKTEPEYVQLTLW